MSIAQQTRFDSYIKTPKRHRKQLILDTLGNNELTAREIATRLGFYDLNTVKPRITELVQAGKLIEVDTKYDPLTDRNVTTYRKAPATLER